MKSITSEQLYERVLGGQAVDLIDVRSPAEFDRVHARGAKRILLDEVTPQRVTSGRHARDGEPLYVICQSGGRSAMACAQPPTPGVWLGRTSATAGSEVDEHRTPVANAAPPGAHAAVEHGSGGGEGEVRGSLTLSELA